MTVSLEGEVKTFPIMHGQKTKSIPWELIAPHEAQAQKNHRQSLSELARRGGLSPCEAMAVLEDRPWHAWVFAEAFLAEKVRTYEELR